VEEINREEESTDQEEAYLAKETEPDQVGHSNRNGDLNELNFALAVEDFSRQR